MRLVVVLMLATFLAEGSYAQKWLQRADFGNVGRHRATAVTIGNKGYMGLGHTNGTGTNIIYKDWWQYDPASNSWTQKADYVVPNYATGAFATDTKAYIGGGTQLTYEFYEYDPLTNAWTAIPNCPVYISDQTAFAVNNKGYVINNNQCYEFNPAGNSWNVKNTMPFTVGIWSTSFVLDGSAYVKSGNQLYEYKASADTWIMRAPCPGVATAGSSSFGLNGKGYIISGYVGWLSELTKEIWEYNPGNNTWTQLEDFEGAARRFSCGITIQDRGYFGLGTNGINFNDWWAYDGNNLGVKENAVECTVYPNPTSDWLKVERKGGVWDVVQLIDESGKVLISEKQVGEVLELNVNQLPAGSYHLLLRSEDQPVYQQTIQILGQ